MSHIRPLRSSATATIDDRSADTGRSGRAAWVWVAGAFAAAGAAQFLTQVAVGRVLGPAAYGEAATLIALMGIAAVPMTGVQLATTSLVAGGSSAAPTIRRFMLVVALVASLLAAAAPWWAALVTVDDVLAARLATLYLPAAMLMALMRGVCVGRSRTRTLAAAVTLGALVRTCVAAAAAAAFGVPGAVIGPVACELASAVFLIARVGFGGSRSLPAPWRSVGGATYSQVAMWVVVNVDLLWARRLLDPVDAGRYLFAGGVAMGFLSVGQAYLWHRASSITTERDAVAVTVRAMGVVAVVAVLSVPGLAWGLPVVLGDEFGAIGGLLAVTGLASVFACALTAGTSALVLATGRGVRRLVPLLALAATPPLWFSVVGAGPARLAGAAALNALVGALVLLGPAARRSVTVSAGSGPSSAKDPHTGAHDDEDVGGHHHAQQ